MMRRTIRDALYENGLLRPMSPLSLRAGERVAVIVVRRPDAARWNMVRLARASPRFWRCYRGLPKDVQSLADKSYALLKANPSHPSVHFKRSRMQPTRAKRQASKPKARARR